MGYTLRDLITGLVLPNGVKIIDHLTKSSGIAETAEIIKANKITYHLYEKILSLPSGTIRNIGGSVTPSQIRSEIGQADLQEFAILQEPDAKLVHDLGGGKSPEAVMNYFMMKYPAVLEGMLQTISTQMIYGDDSTFGNDQGYKGFHQYAKASSNLVQLSGTTGSRTSIFAVRWNPDFCAALVDPAVMETGRFMTSTSPVYTLPVTNVTTGTRKPTYDVMNTSDMGLMVATNECVGAITQIDSTHKPSVTNVAALLRSVHARRDYNNTYIYCNEEGADYLDELLNGDLQMRTNEKDYNFVMESFNNIKRVIDENILSTETTVLD
jgi:hypothetical protein